MIHAHVDEISPQEVARALEDGHPLQIVDIRAPARLAGGRIDLGPAERFHNLGGSKLVASRSPEQLGLDPAVPVTVVCGHGNSSVPAAAFLNHLGFQAKSMRGGMAAWMLMALPRDLPTPPSLDRLVQFDRVGKGALGYLLVSDGEAFVIDAGRDLRPYLDAIEESDAELVGVADTHCHADYISGGPALGQSFGIPYHLHPADASYPYDGTPGRLAFDALADAQTIRVGRCQLWVQHTPGHTEGSVTLIADDRAAFTGDFVFVASLGRPDLAGKTHEWTTALWASLRSALSEWPHDLGIYPAHYGSDSERNPDRTIGAPFGALLATNQALTLPDFGSFASWVESKTGTFPEAYRTIKAVNVGILDVLEHEAEELEVGKNECALA